MGEVKFNLIKEIDTITITDAIAAGYCFSACLLAGPLLKNGDLSYSCRRSKTTVFEYDAVKVRVQCTRPQIIINMAAINRMLVPLLLGLISSFITLLQLQVAYINLQGDYARRKLGIMHLISLPANKTAPLK